MTEFSCAGDKSDFDGNNFLLECDNSDFVYISGLEIFQFETDGKVFDYLSLMQNNMIPYTFSIGEKYTYFISTHYKFMENDTIEEGTLLSTTNDNLDPFDYHLEKRGEISFKTLERRTQIRSFYIDSEENAEGEDDVLVEGDVEDDDLIGTNYRNGTNEVVKIFN